MRAIWTGAIGFGLVNIPVRLFSATEEQNLNLDMLDKKDHARIRFRRVNEETGKEVAWENIVKGFDYRGKYVVLTDEDFEKASPEKSKTIAISHFIEEDEVDPIYFETPYYLEPQKSGERAYVLLREALRKSGKLAFGDFVLRSRQNLCLLKPLDNILVLYKIRFAREIRSHKDLSVPARATVNPQEMKMAMALIDQLSGKFDIAKIKDSYTDALMDLIKAKAKGRKIAEPAPLRVVHKRPEDLMSKLKASLGNSKKRRAS